MLGPAIRHTRGLFINPFLLQKGVASTDLLWTSWTTTTMLHPDACWLCWSFFSKLFTCCCAQIMISLWIRQAMTKALVLAVTVLTLLSIQTAASTPGPSPSVSWVTDFLASDLWIFKKYRFDVNLVYTTRLHPNCTTTLGPQPTVVVSTRYTPENDDDFVEWTPMLVYTDAG